MDSKIYEIIKQQGMLPLYYNDSEAKSIRIMEALYGAGIRAIEYTNRGSLALNNFKAMIKIRNQKFPDLLLATGTIKDFLAAGNFIDCGADFLISPCFSETILETVHKRKATWIPACMTPTEINHAEQRGIRFVKLFPGNVLQPKFVSAVKELFPDMDFMPTGGVDDNNIKDWFAAGVSAVGMGSKLITKELVDKEDYDTIQTLTAQRLSLIQSIRNNR